MVLRYWKDYHLDRMPTDRSKSWWSLFLSRKEAAASRQGALAPARSKGSDSERKWQLEKEQQAKCTSSRSTPEAPLGLSSRFVGRSHRAPGIFRLGRKSDPRVDFRFGLVSLGTLIAPVGSSRWWRGHMRTFGLRPRLLRPSFDRGGREGRRALGSLRFCQWSFVRHVSGLTACLPRIIGFVRGRRFFILSLLGSRAFVSPTEAIGFVRGRRFLVLSLLWSRAFILRWP